MPLLGSECQGRPLELSNLYVCVLVPINYTPKSCIYGLRHSNSGHILFHVYRLLNPGEQEWHYCIFGLDNSSPYEGGYYHGKLIFPEQYPFKPPGIMMITPSGRSVTVL